jgi:hypothetical protein
MADFPDLKALDLAGRTFAQQADEDARFIYAELRGAMKAEEITLPPISEFTKEAGAAIHSIVNLDGFWNSVNKSDFRALREKACVQEGHVAGETILFGFVILGLAALSKVRYTKAEGLEFVEGFPGLAEVLKNLPRF